MKKTTFIILFTIIIFSLSSCITFQKQSPLLTKEYLEGMPLVLEFARPITKIEIYNGNSLIYNYNGDIIYNLKTNLILHDDITIKITEFYKNRQYTETIKKIEPDLQFLLYGGADNSLDVKYEDPITNELDYFFDLDISEIEKSVKNSPINTVVTVLGDRAAKRDEIIFISSFNGQYAEYRYVPENLQFNSELSSASTRTIFKFLDILAVKNKNTIKVLDLWDHGNGWAWESKGITLSKAIIQDDTTESYLKIKDIKAVISEYNNIYNSKINVLAFDACNMTSFEIIYEFKDLVDYFIGSVYSIAGFGFYYDFFHNLDINNLERSFVSNIVEKYKYYYTEKYYINRLSLVAVDMKKINIIWNKVTHIINVKNDYNLYRNDGNNYISEPTDMIDINSLILDTGEFLSNYVNPAIINAVVRIDGIDYPEYSGIGIMFEDIFNLNNSYYDDYKSLSFYNDFQSWIENIWKNIIKNK